MTRVPELPLAHNVMPRPPQCDCGQKMNRAVGADIALVSPLSLPVPGDNFPVQNKACFILDLTGMIWNLE
jgi:hypothetical protein